MSVYAKTPKLDKFQFIISLLEDKTNFVKLVNISNFYCNFAKNNMVLVAQLVRASDCGSKLSKWEAFFYCSLKIS
jgi:hypothetical protein